MLSLISFFDITEKARNLCTGRDLKKIQRHRLSCNVKNPYEEQEQYKCDNMDVSVYICALYKGLNVQFVSSYSLVATVTIS